MSLSFEQLIAPITPSDFFDKFRGRSPVLFSGRPSRYQSLPNIGDLNETLAHYSAAPGTFRLNRREGSVPLDTILKPILNSSYKAVSSEAVNKQLKSGATLVVEHCEAQFKAVHMLCETLAVALCARAYAGLFLVYVPEEPCGLHWDNYDMFICQIAGRKTWPIYKPMIHNPVFSRERIKTQNHKHELFDEITLSPGDGLYVPRGWPHNPAALNGPSLHISFAVATPTGADLLEQIQGDVCKGDHGVRGDLPLLSNEEAKKSFADNLRRQMLARMTDEALEAYYADYQSRLDRDSLLLPEITD